MNLEDIKSATINNITPSYVFDIDELRNRVEFLNNFFGDRVSLCYAMKANPFLVGDLINNIERFEVCSPGEFRICEKAKIPQNKLVISGVYKEEKEIERMINNYSDIGIYTVESKEQFRLLNKYADLYERKINVLLRMTSGNQFGMDEETIQEIIKNRTEFSHLNIVGIQLFSGTQKSSLKRLTKELDNLDEFIVSLYDDFGYNAEELEFGPGFPISYFQSEQKFEEEEFLNEFKKIISNLHFTGKITLELGRSIAAGCGKYFTKIVDMKTNKEQNYCIVDGGINQISYYGQSMAMKIPFYKHFPIRDNVNPIPWNICGSLCTVNDILIKQLPLSDLEIGDVLVFENTGAYSVTEGISLFLSRDLPAIYLYSKKNGFVCVRDVKPTDIINSIYNK